MISKANRCYNHISDFFSYAHLIEEDEGSLDDAVAAEFQRVISSFRKRDKRASGLEQVLSFSARAVDHWTRWIGDHDIEPADDKVYGGYFRHDRDMSYLFLALAVEAN